MQMRNKGRLTTGAWQSIEVRGRRPKRKAYEKPGKVVHLDPAQFTAVLRNTTQPTEAA